MKNNPIYKALFSLPDAIPSEYKVLKMKDSKEKEYAMIPLPPITDGFPEEEVAVHFTAYPLYKPNEMFNDHFSVGHFTFEFPRTPPLTVHVNYNRSGEMISIRVKPPIQQDAKAKLLQQDQKMTEEEEKEITQRVTAFTKTLLSPLLQKIDDTQERLAKEAEQAMTKLSVLGKEFRGKNPAQVNPKTNADFSSEVKACIDKIKHCNEYNFSSKETPMDLRYKFLEKMLTNLDKITPQLSSSVDSAGEAKLPISSPAPKKRNKIKKRAQAKKIKPEKEKLSPPEAEVIDPTYSAIEAELKHLATEIDAKPVEVLLATRRYLATIDPLELSAESAIKVFAAIQANQNAIQKQFDTALAEQNLSTIKQLSSFISFFDLRELERLVFADALEIVAFLLTTFPMSVWFLNQAALAYNSKHKSFNTEGISKLLLQEGNDEIQLIGILEMLIMLEHLEMLKLLLKYPGINSSESPTEKSTPLLTAIQQQQPSTVALLLDAKADPNYHTEPKRKKTAIASKSLNQKLRRDELREKAAHHFRRPFKPEVKQKVQETRGVPLPLGAAVLTGNEDIVRLLTLARANPRIQEMVRGPERLGMQRRDALAALTCQAHPLKWMEQKEGPRKLDSILSALLEAKADINALQDFSNRIALRSPLFLNIEKGREQMVTLLLDSKADPNLAYTGIDPIATTPLTGLSCAYSYANRNQQRSSYQNIFLRLVDSVSISTLACHIASIYTPLPIFTLTLFRQSPASADPLLHTYRLDADKMSFAGNRFSFPLEATGEEPSSVEEPSEWVLTKAKITWEYPSKKENTNLRLCVDKFKKASASLADDDKRRFAKELLQEAKQALTKEDVQKISFFSRGVILMMTADLSIAMNGEDASLITQAAEYLTSDASSVSLQNPASIYGLKLALMLRIVYNLLEQPWGPREKRRYPKLQSIFEDMGIDDSLTRVSQEKKEEKPEEFSPPPPATRPEAHPILKPKKKKKAQEEEYTQQCSIALCTFNTILG